MAWETNGGQMEGQSGIWSLLANVVFGFKFWSQGGSIRVNVFRFSKWQSREFFLEIVRMFWILVEKIYSTH